MKVQNDFINSYKLSLNHTFKAPSFAQFLAEQTAQANSELQANSKLLAIKPTEAYDLIESKPMQMKIIAAMNDKAINKPTADDATNNKLQANSKLLAIKPTEASQEREASQPTEASQPREASQSAKLAQPKSRFSPQELIALKEQTDAFEAFFIKNMLDVALPRHKDDLFGKDAGDEIYQDMYHDAIAKALSGKMGLSEILFEYLKQS